MLIVDSREKPKAIKTLLSVFDAVGVQYMVSKLPVGDYMEFKHPELVIDRKQTIAELAKNCTTEHDRFKAELERAKSLGVRLIILVEQDRYKDRDKWIRVRSIQDLMLWSSPHTSIRGEKVFRILSSWVSKYDIDVQFCDKRQTGRRILQIIYGDRYE